MCLYVLTHVLVFLRQDFSDVSFAMRFDNVI